jgi:hypothetical protein
MQMLLRLDYAVRQLLGCIETAVFCSASSSVHEQTFNKISRNYGQQCMTLFSAHNQHNDLAQLAP